MDKKKMTIAIAAGAAAATAAAYGLNPVAKGKELTRKKSEEKARQKVRANARYDELRDFRNTERNAFEKKF